MDGAPRPNLLEEESRPIHELGPRPDRSIKVLSVSLFNHLDGVTNRVLLIARSLRRFGVETVVVTPKAPGQYAREASIDNRTYQVALSVPQELLGIESLKVNLMWLLSLFRSTFIIAQIIDRESIDIVHVNGLLSLQAALAAALTRRKLVWHLISSMYPSLVVLLLMPFVNLVASRMILVANSMRSYYRVKERDIQEGRVVIIHEPVDTDRFDPAKVSKERIEALKQKFNIPPGTKIFGSVGSITPQKGFEYLVRAAQILRREMRTQVIFVIAGRVVQSRALCARRLIAEISRHGVEENFVFADWVNDMVPFYAMLDLLVLPSIAEGTPLAILEAMSMQVPVVASNVGGISEQVLHEQTGLLVNARDSNAIASAIVRLCNDGQLQAMSKRAREYVVSAYSLKRCVSEHFRMYSSLVGQGRLGHVSSSRVKSARWRSNE